MIQYHKTKHFLKDSKNEIVNKYQKPLRLYLQLLQMFVPPHSTVIDATGGTGSLEIAALEPGAPKGLSFITFENNEYQHGHFARRLENCCKTKSSDFDDCDDCNDEELDHVNRGVLSF